LCVTPASAGGCQHLLVDPAGDADQFGDPNTPYPTGLDDPSQVDVRWAELRTTRTQLIATIKLTELAPEGPRNLSHAYSVTFTTGMRDIELIAFFDTQGLRSAEALESVAGSGYPDDGGAYVGQTIGDIQATRDLRADQIVLTADRSLLGGVEGKVTGIGATGWGAIDYPVGDNSALYAVADRAHTTRSYRPGAAACLR
jgi:hypothetical protein